MVSAAANDWHCGVIKLASTRTIICRGRKLHWCWAVLFVSPSEEIAAREEALGDNGGFSTICDRKVTLIFLLCACDSKGQ